MESKLYPRPTICGGRFRFGTLIISTVGISNMDNYVKFHVITDIIQGVCSGSTRVIDTCLGVLRNTAIRVQRNGGAVTLELLVNSLRSDEDLTKVLTYLRSKASPGEEPEGATILLVSCIGEHNIAVCKVEIKIPITESFSRLQACGLGYDNPKIAKILDSLPYDAPKDDVVSKAIAAFEEASRIEDFPGGHVVILSSDDGGPWTFYKKHPLPIYDWNL